MSTPVTSGIHHIGLTVSRLEESAAFFTGLLRNPRKDEKIFYGVWLFGLLALELWHMVFPELVRQGYIG